LDRQRRLPQNNSELYDINVLSTQRVNRAALPHMRKRRSGLLVWVSSSSVAGGTPPYLSPYFAAKAGMDAIAVSYARELALWGIETSIVVPGAFTGGTNHFAHAGQPADAARAAEYNAGPYANYARKIMGRQFTGRALVWRRLARVFCGRGKFFIPTWFCLSALNLFIGVKQAGYSIGEELPIFLLIFIIPASIAALVWWRSRV
jgi:NAD(P)-dependent dehydrogenase (short-subunit alcohol dehydrogenase family)